MIQYKIIHRPTEQCLGKDSYSHYTLGPKGKTYASKGAALEFMLDFCVEVDKRNGLISSKVRETMPDDYSLYRIAGLVNPNIKEIVRITSDDWGNTMIRPVRDS